MRFRIADTFTASLGRLPNEQQKAAKTIALDSGVFSLKCSRLTRPTRRLVCGNARQFSGVLLSGLTVVRMLVACRLSAGPRSKGSRQFRSRNRILTTLMISVSLILPIRSPIRCADNVLTWSARTHDGLFGI